MGLNCKKKYLAILIGFVLATNTYASIVRSDVDYTTFRDFAENKGKFTPGVSNVEIFTKSGQSLGMMMENIPMVDFSATTIGGAGEGRARGTLIDPQYIVSVEHNTGYYQNVNFGSVEPNRDDFKFHYKLANMHQRTPRTTLGDGKNSTDHVKPAEDYQSPKLIRMVTEVAPASLPENTNFTINKDTFAALVRRGSGDQGRDIISDNNGVLSQTRDTAPLHGGPYLTAGSGIQLANQDYTYQKDKVIIFKGPLWDGYNGPLVTQPQTGDSGSAIFAYDKAAKKWVVLALAQSVNVDSLKKATNPYWSWNVLTNPGDFAAIKAAYAKENKVIVNNDENRRFTIKNNSNPAQATITADGHTVTTLNMYDAAKGGMAWDKSFPAYDAGRDLTFSGMKGQLLLDGNMDQGAGALYFNTDFSVDGKVVDGNKPLWSGAGVVVAKDKTVHWNLAASREDDRMSKLGKGSLVLTPTVKAGNHLGQISVGDGTVVLDLHSDDNSKADLMVGIVSGRSTVKIKNAQALDTKKMTFGFRGGKLDMNGNDLNFERIRHIDAGATIVNDNSSKAATLTLTGLAPKTLNQLSTPDYTLKDLTSFSQTSFFKNSLFDENGDFYDFYIQQYHYEGKDFQWRNDLYTFNNNEVTDNATLNLDRFRGPATALTREGWNKIGSIGMYGKGNIQKILAHQYDQLPSSIKAMFEKLLPNVNKRRLLTHYSGFLGNRGYGEQGILNIVYNPTTTEDRVFFTGGANTTGDLTIKKGHLTLQGAPVVHADDHQNGKIVTLDDDYVNPNFKFKKVTVEDGAEFQIGRNVNRFMGDINLGNNAQAILGYSKGDKAFLVNTAYGGAYDNTNGITDKGLKVMPTTNINSNINLANGAEVTLGHKAHLFGKIEGNGLTSNSISLKDGSTWSLTGNSNLGNVVLSNATILLNHHDPYSRSAALDLNTLTINGDLIVVNAKEAAIEYGTDITQTEGNNIIVKGNAKGKLLLKVHNQGKEPTVNKLHLLEVTGDHQDLHPYLIDEETGENHVDLGAYQYELKQYKNGIYGLLLPKEQEKELINIEEEKRKAEEEAKRLEEEKQKAEEEAKRLEEEKRKAEEAQQKAKEEANQQAEEAKQKAEEAKQKAEEAKQQAEEAKRKAEEAKKKAEEAKHKLEQAKNTHVEQADIISRYTNTGISEYAGLVQDLQVLDQQLTNTYLKEKPEGLNVWTTHRWQQTNHSSQFFRHFDHQINLDSLGISYVQGGLQLGGIYSYGNTSHDFDGNMKAEGHINGLNLFIQKTLPYNTFVTSDIGYLHTKQKVEDTSFKRNIPQLGFAFGKKVEWNNLMLKGLVGMRYHHLPVVNYQLNGAHIHLDSKDLWTANTALEFGYKIPTVHGYILPNLQLQYNHPMQNSKVMVNNIDFQVNFAKIWQISGGFDMNYGAFHFNSQIGVQNGSHITTRPFANITLGWNW